MQFAAFVIEAALVVARPREIEARGRCRAADSSPAQASREGVVKPPGFGYRNRPPAPL
jgi:hypothetical protein